MKRLIEKEWITKEGNKAIVLLVSPSMPHRYGYVQVSNENRNYGKEYDTLDINVHGGLTYSSHNLLGREGWWFCFDAAHYMDGWDWEAGKALIDTDKLKEIISRTKNITQNIYEPGSLEYMIYECNSLSEQLEK